MAIPEILGRLHPLLEHLPIENMVYTNQQAYYDAITQSTTQAQSGPFIEFMLGEILNTLSKYQDTNAETLSEAIPEGTSLDREFAIKFGEEFGIKFGINEKRLLLLLHTNPSLTAQEISARMDLTLRGVEKQIKRLKEAGIISRQGSRKTGFWSINK